MKRRTKDEHKIEIDSEDEDDPDDDPEDVSSEIEDNETEVIRGTAYPGEVETVMIEDNGMEADDIVTRL